MVPRGMSRHIMRLTRSAKQVCIFPPTQYLCAASTTAICIAAVIEVLGGRSRVKQNLSSVPVILRQLVGDASSDHSGDLLKQANSPPSGRGYV